MGNNFSEKDKQKVIEFLNFIAQNAEFKVNTQEVIKYFGLLSFMQKELLPKIEDNILEVRKLHEPKKED